jgi:hypothetical protein
MLYRSRRCSKGNCNAEGLPLEAGQTRALTAHCVGSIPLADAEAVFRRLAGRLGSHLARLPDGETGVRQMWIKFLQDRLAQHPAVEVAEDLPPFRFTQWDGKLIREISRKRLLPGAEVDPDAFASGYAEMAIASWRVFQSLQRDGVIPAAARFQVCMPTPIAPVYNNIVPADRPRLLPPLTRHFIDELERMTAVIPHERLAVQWDVCQEVLAWEGYYEAGPVDFRDETIDVLRTIGAAVPAAVELGFHLCYGSPADEHIVQPADTGIMVELSNALAAALDRRIDFLHMPVPKSRADDAYFEPLESLAPDAATALYLGLIHYRDAIGDRQRLAAARRHAVVHGVACECGLGRGEPARLDELLSAHAKLIEEDEMREV